MDNAQFLSRYASYFVNALNFVAQFLCFRLLELIVIVIVMQVVLRFVFNSPTKWSEEVALICLVWFGMLAAAVCVRRGTHVAITFFSDLLPNLGRNATLMLTQVFILVFALILVLNGFQLVQLTGSVRLPASQLPKAMLYMSAITGGGLMLVNALANLIEVLRDFQKS